MKQYCRYCVNAYLQGDDMIWCKPKDEIRTDRQITRLNRCPHFEFCSIDVLNPEREYRPVEKRMAAQEADLLQPVYAAWMEDGVLPGQMVLEGMEDET